MELSYSIYTGELTYRSMKLLIDLQKRRGERKTNRFKINVFKAILYSAILKYLEVTICSQVIIDYFFRAANNSEKPGKIPEFWRK